MAPALCAVRDGAGANLSGKAKTQRSGDGRDAAGQPRGSSIHWCQIGAHAG